MRVVSIIVLFSFVLTSCSSNNDSWGESQVPDPTKINKYVTVNRCIDYKCNNFQVKTGNSFKDIKESLRKVTESRLDQFKFLLYRHGLVQTAYKALNMIDLAITKMLEWESGSLLNSTGPWGKVVVYFSAMFVLPGSALLGEGGWWLSHTSKTINGFDGTHYTLLDNLAILFLPPILSMRYHGIFLFGDDVTIADAVIKVAPMVSSM